MKIVIKSSCIGKDGEHLEQGSTIDYPDDVAAYLIRMGRAVSADAAGTSESGDASGDDEAEKLMKLTKDALLELATTEEVEVKATATKAEIVEAILLKRSAAA